MERRKANKVVRVSLSGGLVGLLGTNPRKALEDAMQEHNVKGWNCHQVIPHEGRNWLVGLVQGIVLILTLGIWTFRPGYLLLLEKDVTDNSHWAGNDAQGTIG